LIPILLKERSVNKTKKEEGWKSRGGNVNRRFSPFFVEVHKKICFPSFLLTYIIPSRKERIRFTSLFLHLSSFFSIWNIFLWRKNRRRKQFPFCSEHC
jgi:hypothetical protein